MERPNAWKSYTPEDIEKLSIPFERVDISKNYRIEGTGLGLNIVNNLLALMDSELKIESVYGQGSEFSFEIVQGICQEEEGQTGAEEMIRSEGQTGSARTGSRLSAQSAEQIGAEEAQAGSKNYRDIDYSYDRIIEILKSNVSEEFLVMPSEK